MTDSDEQNISGRGPFTLEEYLTEKRSGGFSPYPTYFPDGDFLTYYAKDEWAYEETIDRTLTIYRGVESGEVVGVKLLGVSSIFPEEVLRLAVEGCEARRHEDIQMWAEKLAQDVGKAND